MKKSFPFGWMIIFLALPFAGQGQAELKSSFWSLDAQLGYSNGVQTGQVSMLSQANWPDYKFHYGNKGPFINLGISRYQTIIGNFGLNAGAQVGYWSMSAKSSNVRFNTFNSSYTTDVARSTKTLLIQSPLQFHYNFSLKHTQWRLAAGGVLGMYIFTDRMIEYAHPELENSHSPGTLKNDGYLKDWLFSVSTIFKIREHQVGLSLSTQIKREFAFTTYLGMVGMHYTL